LRNVSEQQGLEGWVAAKITLASDYLNTVREHLEYQLMSQVQPDSMEFPVAEGAMPASVIRVKEKIRQMSDAEKKEYFRGKTREQLQKMARSHGYGENSNVYAKYATETVAEGMGEFDKVKTSPYEARQMLGGKYPVRFAIEVLLPDQSVVSMIQKKLGRAYNIERDDSIEGNGIGIEIVSRRFEGGQTAQIAYDQLVKFIEQNGGQFNNSTGVTIYKQKQGVVEGATDLASLKAKASKISDKIDAIVKDGGRVGLDDPLSKQLKSIQAKIQQAKKQGVAEDGGTSSAGAMATVNNPGGKPKSQVGSLFGGTYQRENKTTSK